MYRVLLAEMARAGVTRGDLARDPEIDCTPSTMSLKLNGKAPITLAEATRIKEIIKTDLTIEELFTKEA